ncbi:AI-2E family transporter [Pontibacter cellulosilyticus]|uniref:AI-2E family transporter n=1 Tax=Pontibacter cellulosilyticus TaxID=1720253 RepID=A0A923SM99_9BACT|nr:AI-2E family transporter [Pontibacter cellulosilyticus]MBC5991975.1 AI-2E family transporter [Pontibacter cellulosilyticus]
MNTKSLSQFNKGLLGVLLISILLYLGKSFLIPIAIAAFFAMLLYPMVLRLQQRFHIKEPVAALLSILLLLTVLVAIGTTVYYQVKSLESDLPRIEAKVDEKTERLQWLLYEKTDLSTYEQEEIIEEKKPDIVKAVFKSVRDFVLQGLIVLVFVFIVLTYTFFFMVYQQRIQNFFIKLRMFDSQKEAKVMLARVSRIIHDYLKGTLSVISILAVVYALGFWAIDLEHAILFALITALLRIIPYFGSFLGIAFPIAYALLTKDSFWYPAAVLLFFMATQILEANLLTPYITGSRVKLNPLATVFVILLGNLIWGIAGMILFVPLFASLKIFFDKVPHLNAYAYILGNGDVEEGLAPEEEKEV